MQLKLSVINEKIRADAAQTIGNADRMYEVQFKPIAEFIAEHRKERPIILLSGPSGSGKTTTAGKIEQNLEQLGLSVKTVSVDDYFKSLTPEDRAARVDLESPERLDGELLSSHIEALIRGETVAKPRFDFSAGCRYYTGETLSRSDDEILLFEGIHVLNPQVITLPDNRSTRLYVSVRTRVELSDGTLVHPTMIRLMRRMLRGQNFRGKDVGETLKLFSGVQRGENRFIMPYRDRAMFNIDTFLSYEPAVYRNLLLPKLKQIKNQNFIDDMIHLLEQAEPLSVEQIGKNSLLHEFIG